VPPAWLSISSLETVLAQEIEHPDVFSSLPPPHSARSAAATGGSGGVPVPATSHDTPAGYLPYHYLSMAHLLLASAPSSFPGSALQALYTLLRDIREVRQSKLRAGMKGLEGGGVVSLRGVGGLEVANERGFVVGVVDGLRTLGASREGARREAQATGGGGGDDGGLSEDEEMEL
jgi:GINS complex subunit 2